jgi:hypothetical protein
VLKKVLTLIIVVMAIALVATTVASAQETEATDGGLRARGDGIAVLRGTGMVDLSGNGTLWVKDLGGDAIIRVTGTGHKKEFSDGWIQYAGFDGAAHVAGSRVHVILPSGTDRSTSGVTGPTTTPTPLASGILPDQVPTSG